ncbi:uncharacterized protein LOC123013288 isoform X2 [Tribolium madens]|uniref:uncharacterized protein LOC123013288 isoform X2 n=1 Tax=Tribolium madens TaxID=41895 RepID=UPI001CF75D1A|nr:uncharacterized protein LOC123013288 isoform X2 [Tribolium madens]
MKVIQFLHLFFAVFVTAVLPKSNAEIWNKPPSCFIDNQRKNYLRIDEPVYDTDEETIISQNRQYEMTNVRQYVVNNYPYFKGNIFETPERMVYLPSHTLQIRLMQIDEKKEISRAGDFYYYNFTITLICNNDDLVDVYTVLPIIDTNNPEPFFGKPKYTYNLISSYAEDFKRQQLLNPIIATDYDVTNAAVQFTMENNPHFDIMYNGIVANTLNKHHYALLTPKVPGKLITDKIEVTIKVTDMGFPPRSNVTKVVIITRIIRLLCMKIQNWMKDVHFIRQVLKYHITM